MSPAMTAFAAELTRAHRQALREEDRLRDRWFRPVDVRRNPVKDERESAKRKAAARGIRQSPVK
jgi:hypothetical protein